MKTQQPTRECGGCTACCKVMGVPELSKPDFVVCGHATKKVGCGIYEKRPTSCREFNCLWAYGLLPEGCRPDKIGIVCVPTGDQTRMQAMEVWPGAAKGDIARVVLDSVRAKMDVIVVHSQTRRTLLTVEGRGLPDALRGIPHAE